ncbi:MAG: hypothetical protein ABW321_23470 [Polyangiales bacterium]
MAELTEHEARELAGALRPNRRPMWYAVSVNLVLAGLLLGVPYLRGQQLARDGRAHFVAFARCMIGGEVAPTPGLSLPRGEREHYAAKYLFAEPAWPLSCRSELQAVRPPDATFLWPSVKVAGSDLRAAIDLVDRELGQLAQRRKQAPARVPARPLDAMKRLQAAAVLYARSADVARHLDNDCLVLGDEVQGLVAPARLPLMIGESVALEAWSDAGTLEALSLDAHNLAYLRVENGKLDRQRIRRNSFLRGFVRAGSDPFLVWAMPDDRCPDREDHCVGRPTGFARFDKGSSTLGEPSWRVPGHPSGRLDRSLTMSTTGRVDLLTKHDDHGGLELIRTRIPETPPGTSAPNNQWLETEARWLLPPLGKFAAMKPARPQPSATAAVGGADNKPAEGEKSGVVAVGQGGATAAAVGGDAHAEPAPLPAQSATVVAGEPVAVLRAADAEQGVSADLTWTSAPGQTLALPPAAGSGAWVTACSAGDARFLAYGSTTEVHVASLSAEPSVRSLGQQPIVIDAPIDERDRARDKTRLVCTEQQARFFYLDPARVLWQVSCAADSCQAPREVSRDVSGFSVVQRGAISVVAFHAAPTTPTIRLLRLDEQGAPMGEPAIVASCWEPLGGVCGTPTLVSAPERVILLSRDGPDMLALETINEGASYTTLSGFSVRRSLDASTTSPLEQHRRKKGMDRP